MRARSHAPDCIFAAALSLVCLGSAWGSTSRSLRLEDRLIGADTTESNRFGYAVGMSESTAVIGAWGNGHSGNLSGAAYLFDLSTRTQRFKLTPSDGAELDFFGRSAAISGATIVVGSPGDDDAGSESGSAYIFDAATGGQLRKITATDASSEREFGDAVAVDGNIAIVGATSFSATVGRPGSAYFFDVASGKQTFKLTARDGTPRDSFGDAVAIHGNRAIVGAPLSDDAGSASGSAYLFDVTTGRQLAKFTASDAGANDWFGSSVALNGSVALIGAHIARAVYVFDIASQKQLAKLTAADTVELDSFGRSVALSGNLALIGALTDEVGINSGSAYLFDLATYTQIAKLDAFDSEPGDAFGSAVAISGDTVLIGAQGDDDAGDLAGVVYLATVPEPEGVLLACLAFWLVFPRSECAMSGRLNDR